MIAKLQSKFRGYLNPTASEDKLKALENKALCLEKKADNAEKEAGFRTRIAKADERIKVSKARSAVWSSGSIRIVAVLMGLALIVLLITKTC